MTQLEFKWTFAAIKKFEKRGRELLKRLDIKNDRGQLIATAPMHAGMILGGYLRISDILEAAVGAAANLPDIEGKKGEPSEAAQAIDDYLSSGGSLESLQQDLFRSYQEANDPSSVAEWEAAMSREKEALKVNREKAETRLKIAQMELAQDQEKLTKLSGDRPTP